MFTQPSELLICELVNNTHKHNNKTGKKRLRLNGKEMAKKSRNVIPGSIWLYSYFEAGQKLTVVLVTVGCTV